MGKQQKLLLLCDTEEEYAELFGEYLRLQKDLPWEVRIYTDVQEMLSKERQSQAAILVVSETAFCEEMKTLPSGSLVLLNESGLVKWEQFQNINKYQEANAVVRELLEIYMDCLGEGYEMSFTRMQKDFGTKFIGMYSPVKRCMQTSFALALSQMLSQKYPTLYLNFEHYAGITELLPEEQTRDMADLLYFLTAEREKFRLRMQTMIQHKGNLDYIPPMKMGQNLLSITTAEWIRLMQRIAELGEYEYVVLDLSESMQGLFDILRMCNKVFTMTQSDRVSRCKLMQYEQLLTFYEYSDVLDKTKRCCPPVIRKLPDCLEEYTRGELAEFVKREMQEL